MSYDKYGKNIALPTALFLQETQSPPFLFISRSFGTSMIYNLWEIVLANYAHQLLNYCDSLNITDNTAREPNGYTEYCRNIGKLKNV